MGSGSTFSIWLRGAYEAFDSRTAKQEYRAQPFHTHLIESIRKERNSRLILSWLVLSDSVRVRKSGDIHLRREVDILNRMEQRDSLLLRALKRFSARN